MKLQICEATCLLTRAEDIQHVLLDRSANYDKTPRLTSSRGKRLSGSGMQTISGAVHLRQRRLLQPDYPEASPVPVVRRYSRAMVYIENVIRREIRQPRSPHSMAATPFPFGGGPRLFIAEQLALLEMLAVISQLVPRFRLEVPA